MEAAMPWRAAACSSSIASLPLRAAPLPSRSISARLCLAMARLASAALRYHSTALAKSRCMTKPRSYMTATLKADWAEPASAARISQPAPACWSLAMPMPCTSRRASSSMAATLFPSARLRSSDIGRDAQSTDLSFVSTGARGGGGSGVVAAPSGAAGGGVVAAAGAGVGGAGPACAGPASVVAACVVAACVVAACVVAAGAVAAGAAGGTTARAVAFVASSGGRRTQAPAPAAAASMIANDVITTGRFSRGRFREAAGLPVIPGE